MLLINRKTHTVFRKFILQKQYTSKQFNKIKEKKTTIPVFCITKLNNTFPGIFLGDESEFGWLTRAGSNWSGFLMVKMFRKLNKASLDQKGDKRGWILSCIL